MGWLGGCCSAPDREKCRQVRSDLRTASSAIPVVPLMVRPGQDDLGARARLVRNVLRDVSDDLNAAFDHRPIMAFGRRSAFMQTAPAAELPLLPDGMMLDN